MGKQKWIKEQENLLKDLYSDVLINDISKILGFTTSSIKNKVYRLGFSRSKEYTRMWHVKLGKQPKKRGRRTWSEKEINYLKFNYSDSPDDVIISNLSNKTHNAIHIMACKLHLKRSCRFTINKRNETRKQRLPNSVTGWFDEEINTLKTLYYDTTKTKILQMLPRHNWSGIVHKAYRLGIKRNLSFSIIDSHIRQNRSPANWVKRKITKPELFMIELIKKYSLPIEYTGQGSFMVGRINPDFKVINEYKVIEVFGRTFHDPSVTFKDKISLVSTYDGRIKYFKEMGYYCLIFWDNELNDEVYVLRKIKAFLELSN